MKHLPHQKCTGLTARYTNPRVQIMHHHEVILDDTRLFQWVMGFKPWLKSGVPVKYNNVQSFRRSKGLLR